MGFWKEVQAFFKSNYNVGRATEPRPLPGHRVNPLPKFKKKTLNVFELRALFTPPSEPQDRDAYYGPLG